MGSFLDQFLRNSAIESSVLEKVDLIVLGLHLLRMSCCELLHKKNKSAIGKIIALEKIAPFCPHTNGE